MNEISWHFSSDEAVKQKTMRALRLLQLRSSSSTRVLSRLIREPGEEHKRNTRRVHLTVPETCAPTERPISKADITPSVGGSRHCRFPHTEAAWVPIIIPRPPIKPVLSLQLIWS